jgi:hypothetical protein
MASVVTYTKTYLDTVLGRWKQIDARTLTASHILEFSDAGKVIEMNSASATTVTVPTNASVAFPIGTVLRIYRMGAGTVTPTAAGGVTIRNVAAIAAQYGTVTLRKRATDEWVQGVA